VLWHIVIPRNEESCILRRCWYVENAGKFQKNYKSQIQRFSIFKKNMEKTVKTPEEKKKSLIIKSLKNEVQAKVKQAREALARIDEKLASESNE
jgi:hypothetical protein